MLLPLGIGFFLFLLLALRRGFTLRQVAEFCRGSLKNSLIVIEIMLIIGGLTGLWRQSGTVAYFVTLGISHIPPKLFILAAFLLTSVMSYALGTSFGVAATAGVILISIARAGGVNTALAGGAIFSGLYVGDRGSPASSSACLVSVLTHTDMRDNVRVMLRSSLLPFCLCCALYAVASAFSPMENVDSEITDMLAEEFVLSWYCLIPAVLMIVLPFCGMKVKLTMGISLFASLLVSVFVQKVGMTECLRTLLQGYRAKNTALSSMLTGGGVRSMLEVSGILFISGTYGGIFRGTGMLSGLEKEIMRLSERLGRFPAMLLLGYGVSALFCNQTIAAIMQSQLSDTLYGDGDDERREKMNDIENTVIVVSPLVPWSISCSVPLAMLGEGREAIPLAFFLWLLPLYHVIRSGTKRAHK